MLRNRCSHKGKIIRVEALESRKLMTVNSYIHLGPLTTAIANGPKTAANGWAEISTFNFNAARPGATSSFHVTEAASSMTNSLLADYLSHAKLPEIEIVETTSGLSGTEQITEVIDFRNLAVQSESVSVPVGINRSTAVVSLDFTYSSATYVPVGPMGLTTSIGTAGTKLPFLR